MLFSGRGFIGSQLPGDFFASVFVGITFHTKK